jgi:hypothetical protein
MSRGKASGYSLTKKDVRLVLGMQARGDRDHDIAAWFGVNQGRVAEAKDGKFGAVDVAQIHELPPSGPPGVKGRILKEDVDKALILLDKGNNGDALALLQKAASHYDANEM